MKVHNYNNLYVDDFCITSDYEDYYAIVWPTVAFKIDMIVDFFKSYENVNVISSTAVEFKENDFEDFIDKVYKVDSSDGSYESRLEKIESLTCSRKIVMLTIRIFMEVEQSSGLKKELNEIELSEFAQGLKYSCRDLIKKEMDVSSKVIIHMEHFFVLNRRLGLIQQQIKLFKEFGGNNVSDYIKGIEDVSIDSSCCVIL